MSKSFKKLQPEIRTSQHQDQKLWQILSEKFVGVVGATFDPQARQNRHSTGAAYCHINFNSFVKEEKFSDQARDLVGKKLLPAMLDDMKTDVCLFSPIGNDSQVDWIAEMAKESGIILERVPVNITEKKAVNGLLVRKI